MNEQVDRLKTALADRYTVERQIGEGGMAVVYLAEDVKHKRKVALKVLRAELAAAIGSERFVREIEIAAKLSHPHILPLYNSGDADGSLFYVMPFVEGETLREHLDSEGSLSIQETARLTDDIASALSHAHEQGVVHRDVKPENIMLSGGKAVVADFGIALAVSAAGGERLTETGVALGTPAYMSPEQAFGETNIDGRSDVYALGCVVYEMVSGRVPFEASTPQALLAKHAIDTPPRLRRLDPNIPLYVERAVCRALAKEPDQRFNTPSEMAEVLAAQTVVPQVGRRRLAVLPPINLTNDPEQEYFVQGMHNALISELQRVGVAVIARTSVLQYENTKKPVHEIAGELGVDALIEPSVFRSGNSVELEVRVVDGSTEEYLAEPISRGGELENVVALFRELTGAIAAEVQAALTPEAEASLASARQVNPEAYEAYLKGQFHWQRLTPDSLDAAFEYFHQALEHDPNYAPAYAGIALVWVGRGQMMIVTPKEAAKHASAAARKALALDSELAEVQYVVALVRSWQEWDFNGAEAAFRKTIDLNPNFPDARVFYSNFLYMLERPEEGRAQIERALTLDPFNALFRAFYGFDLFYERKYSDSIRELEGALRLAPDNPVAFGNLTTAYHLAGKHSEAIEMLPMWMPEDHELKEAIDTGYGEGGYEEGMRRFAEVLGARPGIAELRPMMVANIYAWAGEKEKTLEWLELAYEARDQGLPYANQPDFDLVRDDPRWRDLRRRMGLPDW